MCLIIHKPAGAEIPSALLESAVSFNPHGFGVMSFGPTGVVVHRRARTRLADVTRLHQLHLERECVFHLRYRTRGAIDLENTQPLRVTRDIVLAHNGTLTFSPAASARSDTWVFVRDYLRPLLRNRPALLHEPSFQDLVRCWAGPHNRLVFMDARHRKTVIINREAGRDLDGLWLSNTRWFDASRFEWHRTGTADAAPRPLAFFA